jgi:hypothetical protein
MPRAKELWIGMMSKPLWCRLISVDFDNLEEAISNQLKYEPIP